MPDPHKDEPEVTFHVCEDCPCPYLVPPCFDCIGSDSKENINS